LKYPALDVSGVDDELLLALVDDFSPTAADQHDNIVTLFFSDAAGRDRARRELVRVRPDAIVHARDVDDEDWARRSQEHLTPVTVGRITVTPPWFSADHTPTPSLPPPASSLQPHVIVIAPSMGFGTGHHATTRLCLAALQTVNFTNGRALDVGTGSGVLAIAARLLGAREAVGIDNDADAIQAARENLACNPAVDHVRFDVTDLRATPLSRADVITANLTGALLIPSASILLEALEPGGSLIVSGLQRAERDDVVKAFAQARVVWEAEEDGWAALALTPRAESQPRR
jgi:ribosomal protein L11 methyltransferase